MKPGRKLMVTMLAVATLLFVGAHWTEAQDGQPDLRMLMNLDLFEQQQKSAMGQQTPAPNDSMLDQIRALNAMGYLGNTASYPPSDEVQRSSMPGNGAGTPPQSSNPTYNSEAEQ